MTTNSIGKKPLEKHIQTALQVIIVTAILWAGGKLQALDKQMAVLQYQLEQVTKNSGNYVTKDMIDQLAKMRDMQLQQMEQRLAVLERGKK